MEEVKRKENHCHGKQKEGGQVSKDGVPVMSSARRRFQCAWVGRPGVDVGGTCQRGCERV